MALLAELGAPVGACGGGNGLWRTSRALLFDLDGLLIDSEEACFEVAKAILGRHRRLELPEAWYGALVGHSARETYEQLVADFGLSPSLEELLAERRELLARWYAAPSVLPGAEALVTEAARAGKQLAVVSSSSDALVRAAVAALPFGCYFDTVVTADHPMVARLKPAPDPYLSACKLLDVEPAAALAIEDSPTGAAAALEAGIPVVVVPNRWTARKTFPPGVRAASSLDDLLARD